MRSWCWLLWLVGCTSLSAPEVLLEPDDARTGLDGANGPLGAAWVHTRVQARVTDAVPVDIVYPSTAAGDLSVSGAPAAVLVHGGFVAPERYHWLAAHLASHGWVVVLPQADALLAITEPGNGAVALAALEDLSAGTGPLADAIAPEGPRVTLGHSLGGVLAINQWAADPDIDGVVLIASLPAPGEDVEGAGERPVMSLLGTTDTLEIDKVDQALDRFSGPSWSGLVDGMNHYAWTDDPSDSELGRDGELRRALPAVRRDAQRALDAWLGVHVLGGDPALLERDFPGVEVQP